MWRPITSRQLSVLCWRLGSTALTRTSAARVNAGRRRPNELRPLLRRPCTSETSTSAKPVSATARTSAAPEPRTTESASTAEVDQHTSSSSVAEAAPEAVQAYRPGDRRPGWAGFFRGLFGGTQAAIEDTLAAEARRRGQLNDAEPVRASVQRAHRSRSAATSHATSTASAANREAGTALVPQGRVRSHDDDAQGDASTTTGYASVLNRIFSRFAGSPFMRSVLEAKERVSERLDESDHPVVNVFRTIHDRFFAENEMAQVIGVIRTLDPKFTISRFLVDIESRLIPTVLGAYLAGDLETLQEHCTEEAFAMMAASIHERRLSGIVMDTRILDLDHVELVTGRFLDEEPVLIVQFTTQQIHCLRDLHGEVIEGAPDNIRAVYYVWALCPAFAGEPAASAAAAAAAEDTTFIPTWRLMEMVVRGAHATI